MTNKERLEDLAAKLERATKVVKWYPHPYDGTVRGPFCRWFKCSGGSNGMGDEVKYPTPVSDISDDVEYCAAAMNEVPFLLSLITRAKEVMQQIEKTRTYVESDSTGVKFYFDTEGAVMARELLKELDGV